MTEGAADSGALITAKDAFEAGRKVFAVPGPITSNLSDRPNNLLSNGATLVTSSKDILQGLGISFYAVQQKKTEVKGDTDEEQQLIDLLQQEPLAFDMIVRKTGKQSNEISVLLSLMEMKGILKTGSTGEFVLTV